MSQFIKTETGAVTVDWVVLTAALVGVGLAVMGTVSIGVQDTSTDIREQLESSDIIRASFDPAPFEGTVSYSGMGGGLQCNNGGAGFDPSQSMVSQGCRVQNISENISLTGDDGSRYRIKQVDYYNLQNERTHTVFGYYEDGATDANPSDSSGWPESVLAYADEDRHVPIDEQYPNGWRQ